MCAGSLELNLLEVRLPPPSDPTDESKDAGGTVALVLVARVRFALAFLLIVDISFEWARLANVA